MICSDLKKKHEQRYGGGKSTNWQNLAFCMFAWLLMAYLSCSWLTHVCQIWSSLLSANCKTVSTDETLMLSLFERHINIATGTESEASKTIQGDCDRTEERKVWPITASWFGLFTVDPFSLSDLLFIICIFVFLKKNKNKDIKTLYICTLSSFSLHVSFRKHCIHFHWNHWAHTMLDEPTQWVKLKAFNLLLIEHGLWLWMALLWSAAAWRVTLVSFLIRMHPSACAFNKWVAFFYLHSAVKIRSVLSQSEAEKLIHASATYSLDLLSESSLKTVSWSKIKVRNLIQA